jgi:membrane protease YdiL (CAAX protease family)
MLRRSGENPNGGARSVSPMIALLGAIVVVFWVHTTHRPWSDIGYTQPKSWTLTVAGGIAIGVALKFLLKAVVMPLLGAEPVNRYYHYLAGNTAELPAAIVMMFVAGFGEETVFRGYTFERLGKLFGKRRGAKAAILLITSLLFALAHIAGQGRDGAAQALCSGLALGTMYFVTGTIWMPMIAHTAYDLTALWMIYSNLETAVAHSIFK